MQVTQSMIKQAVHGVIRKRRIRAGGWIDLEQLRRDWLQTGLRYADLIDGLQMLRNEHYVALRTDGTESVITIIRRQFAFNPQMLSGAYLLSKTRRRLPLGRSAQERRR